MPFARWRRHALRGRPPQPGRGGRGPRRPSCRAHAGAKRSEIRDVQAGALRVSVTQAPEKGKANKAIVALLAEDVEMSMPPYAEWYRGRAAVAAFLRETPLRPDRRWRLEQTTADLAGTRLPTPTEA